MSARASIVARQRQHGIAVVVGEVAEARALRVLVLAFDPKRDVPDRFGSGRDATRRLHGAVVGDFELDAAAGRLRDVRLQERAVHGLGPARMIDRELGRVDRHRKARKHAQEKFHAVISPSASTEAGSRY